MPNKIFHLLEAIKSRRPVLAELLRKSGNKTLGNFTKTFCSTSSFPEKTIQPKYDLIEIAQSHINNLLGSDVAKKFSAHLNQNANLLTANHHCANISDLPIQGTIAFSLSLEQNGILPIFAFGDIPLNNSRYPRGILFAGDKKLPVFPDKYKNTLVCSAPPFTEEFANKALLKNEKLFQEKHINQKQFDTAKTFLKEMYLDPEVLKLSSYSDQSVILSNKIWKKLFSHGSKLAGIQLVQLEIEKLVSELLILDLKNTSSLAYQMFFNKTLKENLILELDGKNGCWNKKKLTNLLTDKLSETKSDTDSAAGSGTMFFWGIDEKGRRIPLVLIEDKLKGINDSGDEFSLSFTEESLIDALKHRLIIPGLFLSFAAVSFARGYKCYGGFMQVDYLTAMRNSLANSLSKHLSLDWAKMVMNIETENYCTGMIVALFKADEETLFPAGGIEIAASGGLSDSDIERIKSITLEDSNLFGLPSVYKTVYRFDERTEELSSITSMDIYKLKKDNFITIN